jgi:hypothetical protein
MQKMSRTFRQILAESCIPAVTIVVLIIWALDSGVRALKAPLFGVTDFVINAMAIRGIPYGSGRFFWGPWITPLSYAFTALIYLGAAWILSRWVFGMGPLRSLRECCAKLVRRNYA